MKSGTVVERLRSAAAFRLSQLAWRFGYRYSARGFWDRQMPDLEARFGATVGDYPIVTEVIRSAQVRTLLDIGCGWGRLFPLYEELEVERVVAIDISLEAVARARRAFPRFEISQGSLLDLDASKLPRADLAVSNRVLQHIPRESVADVVARICQVADRAYLNELSDSDGLAETYTMVRHDYEALFAARGFELRRRGSLGTQTWKLFARPGVQT